MDGSAQLGSVDGPHGGEERDPRSALAALEKRLLARIRRMMGPEAREGVESGDVLQSVYADTLEWLGSGGVEADRLLPWMTEVARNKIIDEVRRRREGPMSIPPGEVAGGPAPSPATWLGEAEEEQILLAALGRLEPDRRSVVALRCEEGSSWDEIGRTLGRSEGAARKLYHRALLELGSTLDLRRLGPEVQSAG